LSTLTVNGATLTYNDQGQGAPIIFIHGLYASSEQWHIQAEQLKANYRVITVDLRGHGESSSTSGAYSVNMFADDVIALQDSLGLDKVTHCGHSFGGLVAQEIALSHPGRTNGIILAETMYGLCSNFMEATIAVWTNLLMPRIIGKENFAQMIATYFGMSAPGGYEYVLRQAERHLADEANQENIVKASLLFDSRWRLHKIACPTLLIVGQIPHVPVIQLHNWEMYFRISQAELTFIPMAGHLLFWDNPTAFNEAIVKFMTKIHRM
jgi:pimeloyl-ACP methyl ester carboxylesterase